MTSRQQTTIIASFCLVLSMGMSSLFLRRIDETRPIETDSDTLYIGSPRVVRFASLGFDGLAACVYWTRVVQYFGHRHHLRAMTFNELAPLLEITTTLDPHLLPPYQFGASFLAPPPPNGAGQPDRAVQLMEYGIRNNPNDWHLYYNLAFVYYTEFHDYKKAADVFEQGSKVPAAHPYLKLLAARMNEHAGDLSTARLLWNATLESTTEPNVRQNAIDHLRSIQVDEDVTNLHKAVMRFRERYGRPPSNMLELIKAEHLGGVPADPDGDPYLLTPAGRILVQKPESFPFMTKGFPPTEQEFWIVPQYDFDE